MKCIKLRSVENEECRKGGVCLDIDNNPKKNIVRIIDNTSKKNSSFISHFPFPIHVLVTSMRNVENEASIHNMEIKFSLQDFFM